MDKKTLLKRQKELKANLESIKKAASPVDLNDPIGRLSRMDAIQRQMALNSKNQIENNLKLLEQAIDQFENGEYGYCLHCEEGIKEKRLQAKPESPFCLKCQK